MDKKIQQISIKQRSIKNLIFQRKDQKEEIKAYLYAIDKYIDWLISPNQKNVYNRVQNDNNNKTNIFDYVVVFMCDVCMYGTM